MSKIVYDHLQDAVSQDAGNMEPDLINEYLSDSPLAGLDQESGGYKVFTPDKLFAQKTIEDVYQKIFGKTDSLKLTTEFGMGYGYFYKAGNGVLAAFYQGGGDWPNQDNSKLIKAEQQDDIIYLYDRYFRTGRDSVGLYKGLESDIIDADFNNPDGWTGRPGDIDEIIGKYGDKIPTYRHTFRRAAGDSYYWASSERVY